MVDSDPIADKDNPEVEVTTPGTDGVIETPAPVISDDVKALQTKYEEAQMELAKTRNDINALKSAKDREIAAQRREFDEFRLNSMSEADRPLYERKLREDRLVELEDAYAKLQQEMQEREYRDKYINMFRDFGIDTSKLNMSGDYASVANEGFRLLKERISGLEEEVKNAKSKSPVPQPQNQTLTQRLAKPGGTPVTSSTWPDVANIVKTQYNGDVIQFWRDVESGIIDPSILPGMGKGGAN